MKTRVSQLAHELRCKAKEITDILPGLGIARVVTHSSSLTTEEVDAVRTMVKLEMESVRKLEVPLLVDVGVGDNWRDAK